MPGRNGAVARSPALSMARTLPVRSPRRPDNAAYVSDGRIPTALTQYPPDADPVVESAWDSARAGQLPTPVPAPDR